MADTAKQQAWREAVPSSITVHLSAADAATLDAIAIELYERFPHDPPNGVEAEITIYPSRAQAVRELCREWRAANKPRTLRKLERLREELSSFWRAEASWRRAKSDTTGERPAAPWK